MAKKISTRDIVTGQIGGVWIMDNIRLILFAAFLALIYIANAHYAEKKVREIRTLQEEVKQLDWEYMSLKSDLMQKRMESEIAKSLDGRGVKILTKPPNTIKVDKDTEY